MNKAIITANAELVILGRPLSRNMLFYIENFAKISDNPFLYSFSVPKTTPGIEVLRKSGVFAVQIMEDEFFEKNKKAILTATVYEDPVKKLGLRIVSSVKIECPKIAGFISCAECEKVKEMEMGDSIVFIGRALYRENI